MSSNTLSVDGMHRVSYLKFVFQQIWLVLGDSGAQRCTVDCYWFEMFNSSQLLLLKCLFKPFSLFEWTRPEWQHLIIKKQPLLFIQARLPNLYLHCVWLCHREKEQNSRLSLTLQPFVNDVIGSQWERTMVLACIRAPPPASLCMAAHMVLQHHIFTTHYSAAAWGRDMGMWLLAMCSHVIYHVCSEMSCLSL